MHQPIDPHATLDDLISRHPSASRVLVARRMHCVGCAIAAFETLEEACANYRLALDEVLEDLAAAIEQEGNDEHGSAGADGSRAGGRS